MATRPKTFKRKSLAPRHEPEPLTWGSGRGGRPWARLRLLVMERDGWLCQCEECGQLLMRRVAHEVDHIVPLSRGGDDSLDNLRAINRDCHRKKTAREARR